MSRIAFRIGALAFVSLLVAMAVSTCAQPAKIGQIPEEVLIVDVRTAWEFERGHFPDAKNIPLHEMKDRLQEFGPKDKPVVVYCHSGTRSGVAQDYLLKAGYKQVINGGGIEDMLLHAKTPSVDGGPTQ
jgi:phage shock protein E